MQKFKENVRVVKMPVRIVFGESHIERVYWEARLAKIKYRMVLHEEKSVGRYWNLVLSSNDETKNNKRSVVLPPAVSLGNCASLASCLQSKLNQSCEDIPRIQLRREWYRVVGFFLLLLLLFHAAVILRWITALWQHHDSPKLNWRQMTKLFAMFLQPLHLIPV